MSKRRVVVGMVSVVLVAVASLAIHQVYQANSWPSLDDEPPLAVPQVAAPSDSWIALKAVMAAVPMEHRDRIKDALEGKGMSADRGVWALAADQVEALSSVMESSSIVSPTRTLANKDSQPSLKNSLPKPKPKPEPKPKPKPKPPA